MKITRKWGFYEAGQKVFCVDVGVAIVVATSSIDVPLGHVPIIFEGVENGRRVFVVPADNIQIITPKSNGS
mgnify:CR=1 FL=1